MKYLTALLLVLAMAFTCQAQDNIIVIAHPDCGFDEIEKGDLSKVFLKKISSVKGTDVVPVDLKENSPNRESFSSQLIGKKLSSIKRYWQKQIFTGKKRPPVQKESETEMVEFILNTPGAIGYVKEGTDVQNLKVIKVQ